MGTWSSTAGEEEPGEGEQCVEGGFEGTGVPLNLGEEKSSLERGEQGDGQVVGVDAGRDAPGGVKGPQSVADRG